MIRILIADEQPVVRAGIRFIVSGTSDIRVEGEAETASQVFKMIRKGHWDVLVVELGILGRDGGFGVLKNLKRLGARLPVLSFSSLPESEFGLYALRVGAAGFLSKRRPPEELIRAIRRVAGGGRYITPPLAEAIFHHFDNPSRDPLHLTLSPREFQVFLQLAGGATPTKLAQKMKLSVKTISTYRSRILVKLNLESNFELIHYAIRHGLKPSISLAEAPSSRRPAASAAASR